jgi:dTDP-4-amino-4,6-dideoxygalactose transaminase
MSLMNEHTRLDHAPIPFIDIAAQRRRLGRAVDDAVARVLSHCQFVMGPEVQTFEKDLAAFCGARHAISCASGTDALLLVLMARGIGPGDAVFCPTFTFCATAEVVALLGATPVFVDVDETSFNLDVKSLARAIPVARRQGLKPKAVIPVDLFGLPADHDGVRAIAERKIFSSLTMPPRRSAQPTTARNSARSGLRPRPASFPQSRSAVLATAARC